jgi:large subunit ribosomal protein L25
LLHLSDLKLPEGVEILELSHGRNSPVVSIHHARAEEVTEPTEATAAAATPAAGATPAAAATATAAKPAAGAKPAAEPKKDAKK